MKIAEYKQCQRCVMDTSDSDISFNEQGFCNHCTNFHENLSKKIYQGDDSDRNLQHLIQEIKNNGRHSDFDCIIGVSGGVDSSYVVYLAKQLGLRVLAVHMDNGWDSAISVTNIKSIVTKLDVEYVSYVLNWENFKDLQLSFLKASVPEAETPTDMAIQGVVYQLADKYGIKYILSGGNYATEGIMPKSWHYDAKDIKYLKAIQKNFSSLDIRDFPFFGWKEYIKYRMKGIKTKYLLNLIPYSKKTAIKTLESEFNWNYYGGKHHESIYTRFIQSYLLYEKFKIDYRTATFSNKICLGEMSRTEALDLLKIKPYNSRDIEEDINYICKKLDITTDEFKALLKSPNKTHNDYPNNKIWLEFLYKSYSLFFL